MSDLFSVTRSAALARDHQLRLAARLRRRPTGSRPPPPSCAPCSSSSATANHLVRIVAAQQLDAQLIEQHQLLHLLRLGSPASTSSLLCCTAIGKSCTIVCVSCGSSPLAVGGSSDSVKLELVRAELDRVAVDERRFVDLLPVDRVPLRLSWSRTTQRRRRRSEMIAWTREQSGSGSEIWQSVPRPMSVSRDGSSGKFVPARLPVRIVR